MRTVALLSIVALSGCSDATVAKDYLAVISVSPDQGATQVALDTTIIASFSESLVPRTVDQQNVFITDQNGGPVVAAVEYIDKSHWIAINPEGDLTPNATYVVTFTTNIKGRASGYLLAPVQTQFTTTGTNPVNELPIASAGDDSAVRVGDTVVLNGRESTDPESAELSFAWRLVQVPDRSESALSSTTQPTPSFVPDLSGEYVVGLTVNDGLQDSNEDFVVVQALPSSSDPGSDTGGEDTGTSSPADAEDDTGTDAGAPDTGR